MSLLLTNIDRQLTDNDTENRRVTKDGGYYEKPEGNIPEQCHLVVHDFTFWLETGRKVLDLEKLRQTQRQTIVKTNLINSGWSE